MRPAIFNVLAFLAVFGPAYMLLLLGMKRLSRESASNGISQIDDWCRIPVAPRAPPQQAIRTPRVSVSCSTPLA